MSEMNLRNDSLSLKNIIDCHSIILYNVTYINAIEREERKNALENVHGIGDRLKMSIKEQRAVYEFIQAELGNDIDIVKVDTNLAAIINILSKEDLSTTTYSPAINPFEIGNKIEFNNLMTAKATIDAHKIFENPEGYCHVVT
ncbi:MAG: hypothetical protein LBL58_17805 [Tannerellaceae bacterium]|jgi:hypothetical protein|nr:hypothetical protein [Tannerellaceae bacterium]